MTFKPMLAATVTDRAKLRFPLLASPKLDGIRCVVLGGKVLSRSLKPIRNKWIEFCLRDLPDMDGELIVGSACGEDVLNTTTRGVMSADGEPDFKYHAFDTLHDPNAQFCMRLAQVPEHDFVTPVIHSMLSSPNELSLYEAAQLAAGYEGVMLRHPLATYKFGRATPKEGSLWKLKQFTDGELYVTGVREGQENINYATKDALGRTVRSKHQDGMIPNEQVGTILGTDCTTGQHLEISPGKMTHDQRKYFWVAQDHIIGKIVKYKAFAYGSINAPRFATFQAFRDPEDM